MIKTRIYLALILLSSFCYGGNGFLGYSQQVGIKMEDLVTEQAIVIQYDRFFTRHFGMSARFGVVNGNYEESLDYSYFSNPDGGVKLSGKEYYLGFKYSNSFVNKILPVGMSGGYRIGLGFYNVEFVDYQDQLINKDVKQLVQEVELLKTINIINRLNFEIGIAAGMAGQIGGGDPFLEYYEDGEISFVKSKGMNKNIDFDDKSFYLRFQYGLTCMF